MITEGHQQRLLRKFEPGHARGSEDRGATRPSRTDPRHWSANVTYKESVL